MGCCKGSSKREVYSDKHLKELEREEETKPKFSRKAITQIRAVINEIEIDKLIEEIY